MDEDGQEGGGEAERRAGEKQSFSASISGNRPTPVTRKLDDYKSIHRGAEADCWWVANAYAQGFWIITIPVHADKNIAY